MRAKIGGWIITKITCLFQHSLELASSISLGENSLSSSFERQPLTCEPDILQSNMSRISRPLSGGTLLITMGFLLDHRVLQVFQSLQEVTHRINMHNTQDSCLDATTFQTFYDSALSRLLSLKDSLQEDVTSECLRLGLLAFLTLTAYHGLEIRGNKVILYPYLTSHFRDACRAMELSTPQLSTLMLWILTIGAMSVLDVDNEGWLGERWREVAQVLPGVMLSWETAREHLESVLWMRCIHDEMGQKVYDKLKSI